MLKLQSVLKLHPRQEEALKAIGKYRYVYYGGARGGGKTHAAVVIALRSCLKYAGLNTVIIRQTIPELAQHIEPLIQRLIPENIGLYKFDRRDKIFRFYNGSVIYLRPLASEKDLAKEQGIERHLYIIDEANLLPAEFIRRLDGSLRNSRIPNWKPTMFMTGNPGGISDDYFYSHFVNFDPKQWTAQELDRRSEYYYIPATVWDNPSIIENDPDYVETLRSLPEHLRRAWLDGEWGVFKGKFFEEWNRDVHTVHPFIVPTDYIRYRAIDIGMGSHPSVCLWIAHDYITQCAYVYRELIWYNDIRSFAKKIVEMSVDWEGKPEKFAANYADPNIFASKNILYDNEQYFRNAGILLEKSINKRDIGWRALKVWLHYDFIGSTIITQPRLKVFKTCEETIRSLETLQYSNSNPFDCNTKQFDDPADALRYWAVMVPYNEDSENNHQNEELEALAQKMWNTVEAADVLKTYDAVQGLESDYSFFDIDDSEVTTF